MVIIGSQHENGANKSFYIHCCVKEKLNQKVRYSTYI